MYQFVELFFSDAVFFIFVILFFLALIPALIQLWKVFNNDHS